MSNVQKIFYDLPTVADVLSLSESTVKDLIRRGDFPQPRKLSPQRVGWLAREVDAWAECRPLSDNLPPPNCGVRKPKLSQDDQQAA